MQRAQSKDEIGGGSFLPLVPDDNGLSKALHALYAKAKVIRDVENPALPDQDQTKDYRERSPLKNNNERNDENEGNHDNVAAKRIRLFHDEQDK